MKALFQNRKFRKNLYKWLFMYVGVMSLTTTVITYSKYVSSFKSEDSARVAKFAITVQPVGCSGELENGGTAEKICNMGTLRPTGFDYDFIVDTTKMEVKTDLAITLYINENFELAKDSLYDVTGGVEKALATKGSSSVSIDGNSYSVYTIVDTIKIPAGQGSKKQYRVHLRYRNDNLYKDVIPDKSFDVIYVGYSAKQVIN